MPPPAGMPWPPFLDAWIVALVAALLYTNSLDHGFCLDDPVAVTHNPDLDPSRTTLRDVFAHDFWGGELAGTNSHKSYRPLTTLTYRLTFMLSGGLDPWYYHAGNIAAYALACAAWWWVAAHAVPLGRAGRFLAGLAFAVHPMHAENVASVVGRADTLSAVAYVVCIAVYMRAGAGAGGWSWLWLGTSWCAAAVGMLCKEHGLLGVCAGAACDLCWRGRLLRPGEWRWGTTGRALARTLASACFVAGALAWGVWMRGQRVTPKMQFIENPIIREESLWAQTAWWSEVHYWYAVQLLFPRWSCNDWGYNVIPKPDLPWRGALTYTAFFGTPLLLLRTRYRERAVVCSALTIVPFLPSSGILKIGTVLAERLLILPSMGATLGMACLFEWATGVVGGGDVRETDDGMPPADALVGDGGDGDAPPLGHAATRGNTTAARQLRQRKAKSGEVPPARPGTTTSRSQWDGRRACSSGTPASASTSLLPWVLVYATCGVWSIWTVQNSARWRDNTTLYTATLATCSASAKSHLQLASEIKRAEGGWGEHAMGRRLELLKGGLAIAPNASVLNVELGVLYYEKGEMGLAEEHLRRGVEHGRGISEGWYYLARIVFDTKKDHEEGLQLWDRAMAVCVAKGHCVTENFHYYGRHGTALAVAHEATSDPDRKKEYASLAMKRYHTALVESAAPQFDFNPTPEDACVWGMNYFTFALKYKDHASAAIAGDYLVTGCPKDFHKTYLSQPRVVKLVRKSMGHAKKLMAYLERNGL